MYMCSVCILLYVYVYTFLRRKSEAICHVKITFTLLGLFRAFVLQN